MKYKGNDRFNIFSAFLINISEPTTMPLLVFSRISFTIVLFSLLKTIYENFEVIFVDNASSDGSDIKHIPACYM